MSFATRRGLVHLLWMHSSHRLVPLTWDPSRHMPCLESAPLLHRLHHTALSVIKEERSFLFRLPFVITTRDAENQGCFLSKRLLWQTSTSLNQKGPASCLLLLGDSPENNPNIHQQLNGKSTYIYIYTHTHTYTYNGILLSE